MTQDSERSERNALYPLLQSRYSPQHFLDQPIPRPVLFRLFDAARWAPSCFNEQPWRFVIAERHSDPESFERIASTLVPANSWAALAPVLGISVASLAFARNGKPNRWSFHDVGQSMAHLTVQAQSEGLSVRQMGGFDVDKATQVLQIPEGYQPVAAFVIGYPVDPNAPGNRARKGCAEVLFQGMFGSAFPE